MPITSGFTSRTAAKGEGHIHSDKWHRCVEHVQAKGGGYEPHAVCTNAIGYKESVNPEHRTPGPHASANTRRFKEAAKRRREAAAKLDYAQVLKFNPNHGSDGRFTSGASSTTEAPHTPEGYAVAHSSQQKAKPKAKAATVPTPKKLTTPERPIHTDKWQRCIEHVKAKGGGYNPYAVCTNAIGYRGAINTEHRTPGPHPSANTRRFKEAARRRQAAKAYAQVLRAT